MVRGVVAGQLGDGGLAIGKLVDGEIAGCRQHGEHDAAERCEPVEPAGRPIAECATAVEGRGEVRLDIG